jgi:hypothetical protein
MYKMSFLDKFTKGVSKAAEQAKFEADRLMRVNKVGAEVSQLVTETDKATAAIGAKVMELRAAGTLQVPELDEMIQRVEGLKAQVAAKQAELERVRAEKFEGTPAAPPVEVPPVQVTPASAPWAAPAAAAGEPAPQAAAPAPETVPAPEAAAPAPEAAQKSCPACGAAAEAGTKFCPSCGQKLV